MIAFLRGGRIKDIPKFYRLYLLAISIILQVCAGIWHEIAGIFISLSYLFILLFFFFNKQHEDIRIFLLGWFLNALAIWSNKGRMPIDLEQAKKLPYDLEPVINGTNFKHSVLTEATNLPFLTDIIYMPVIIPRVISIGDLFIMLGAFLLIQRLMNKPISLIHLREGKNYAAKG
nr:DUF5317 domain-containing protein [Brevibacillus fulvus]